LKKLFVVGSTGSIGLQTLDIVRMYRDKFEIVGLCAFGNNLDLLSSQVQEFEPCVVGVFDESKSLNFCDLPSKKVKVVYGEDCLTVAGDANADMVVVACSGLIALKCVNAAIKGKKDIALANKECLVACGSAILQLANQYGVKIIPIDSEHSAISQCIKVDSIHKLNRLILTASGGPFYNYSLEQLQSVTVQQALRHPTWKMGFKITIDSATMMNKALELIEARHLYGTTKVDYCIHPQSIIHSMVEYNDGSIIAQLSNPSMHIPIMLAISDQRLSVKCKPLDFETLSSLQFLKKNEAVFDAPVIAKQLMSVDNLLPCVFNSANELAVQLFLKQKIGFLDIMRIVKDAIDCDGYNYKPTIDNVFECDSAVRAIITKKYDS